MVYPEDGVKTGFYRFGEKVVRSGSIFCDGLKIRTFDFW